MQRFLTPDPRQFFGSARARILWFGNNFAQGHPMQSLEILLDPIRRNPGPGAFADAGRFSRRGDAAVDGLSGAAEVEE